MKPLARTAARHDETPTESGCLFAFALVIALAVIIFAGMIA
jgi:hypothetical protein